MSNSYTFAQKPRAVQSSNRYKYRPDEKEQAPKNLATDRRVVRGNTYAAQIPTQNQKFLADLASQRTLRREQMLLERQNRPVAPQEDKNLIAVQGRRHMEVQTDDYLEELDDTVMEVEDGTQTEAYDDKPAPEVYPHPFKVKGEDKMTSAPLELFEFDSAVEPILRALMGKSLDHGLNEVLDEEELKVLQAYRTNFTQEHTDLHQDFKQQEEAALAFDKAKQEHVNQERARLAREKNVAAKVASINTARNFLAGLYSRSIDDLEDENIFMDPAREAILSIFAPAVQKAVMEQLNTLQQAQVYTDNIIENAVVNIMSELSLAEKRELQAEKERKRLEEIRLKEEQAKAEEEAKRLAELEAQTETVEGEETIASEGDAGKEAE